MEALRQSGQPDVQFKVEGDVNDQTIAPLIFIPFLENSFKHGLNHQLGDGYVHVVMKVLGNKLLLRIQNSKPDQLPQPTEKPSGGIGLANVQRRLNLLYPNQYKLDIEESDKEHIVELSLDLTN
jgi:LytS/YehU family sensor histidine kinase